jgi:hypothetical protein
MESMNLGAVIITGIIMNSTVISIIHNIRSVLIHEWTILVEMLLSSVLSMIKENYYAV